jgi:hypothetical protein
MKWLLSILDVDGSGSGGGGGGINLSLPPIAGNGPILSWVWSFIASIQMGQLNDKKEHIPAILLLFFYSEMSLFLFLVANLIRTIKLIKNKILFDLF